MTAMLFRLPTDVAAPSPVVPLVTVLVVLVVILGVGATIALYLLKHRK